MTESYLSLLNDQQRAAVTYLDGPQLVIAGAGAGKTRVLTFKILHLLEIGYEPESILALTFTNKAAREMKERVAREVGGNIARRLRMGTFHSVFLSILRHHADRIGFRPDFTIYDATDSRSLVKLIVKDMGLDDKIYKPSVIASVISNAKNALITPERYRNDSDYQLSDRLSRRPRTADIYSAYCQRCRLADAMDFDDILLYMNILLRDNDDLKEYYNDYFQYILVDEYQDTNFAQSLIISSLSMKRKALCVVGDDAQSIYSFRGADIGNILSMEKRYPTLKIFKLERNYRSTQTIVNAADTLIEKNRNQIRKKVYSKNSVGEKIELIESYSDIEEARMTADAISLSSIRNGDRFEEYAILYRTNAQSRLLEEALRERNIPYRIYGGISFYQRKEVKDAICYMRLVVNPDDDEALRRVINFPLRGIGETTMKKVISVAVTNNVSLWKVISNPEKYKLDINSRTRSKLNNFTDMITEIIRNNEEGMDAFAVSQILYNRSGLSSLYAYGATPEEVSKKENISELLRGVEEFVNSQREEGESDVSLSAFLSQVSLATDQDDDVDDSDKVSLMTVHAAKGLEFKHVIIVGLEEHLFPSALSEESPAELEEERRLLYVAITRAKETCRLSYARSRFRNGETTSGSPSRFLFEINPEYLRVNGHKPMSYNKYYGRDNSRNFSRRDTVFAGKSGIDRSAESFKSQSSDIQSWNYRNLTDSEAVPGTIIRHQKFGEGKILDKTLYGGDTMIIVRFDTLGEKKLLLKFAKLDIVK